MRFAYADPPYLGCGSRYIEHHPNAMIWDDPEEHRRLIERLCDDLPDGGIVAHALDGTTITHRARVGADETDDES